MLVFVYEFFIGKIPSRVNSFVQDEYSPRPWRMMLILYVKGRLVDHELGRMWLTVVVARLRWSLHLPEAIEECHEAQIRIVGLQAKIEIPISRT